MASDAWQYLGVPTPQDIWSGVEPRLAAILHRLNPYGSVPPVPPYAGGRYDPKDQSRFTGDGLAPQGQGILPAAMAAQSDPSGFGAALASSGIPMPQGFSAAQPVDVGAALTGSAPTPIPVQTVPISPTDTGSEGVIPVGDNGQPAPTTGWEATTTPSPTLGDKLGGILGAGLKLMEPPSAPRVSPVPIPQVNPPEAHASFAPAPSGGGSPPHPALARSGGGGGGNVAQAYQQLMQHVLPPKAQALAQLSKILGRG